MISVYRENGKCGLRCDGRVMLQPVFDEIGDFVGDYAIATLFDRNRMMTVQYVVKNDGRTAKAGIGNNVLSDYGMLKDGDILFDPFTGNRYGRLPDEAVTVEWLEFLRFGERYTPRFSGMEGVFFTEDCLTVRGKVFMQRGRRDDGTERAYLLYRDMQKRPFVFCGFNKAGEKELLDDGGRRFVMRRDGKIVAR